MKVQALVNVTDLRTGILHLAGEQFDMNRPASELQQLMRDGLIVILDPALSAGIVIQKQKGVTK